MATATLDNRPQHTDEWIVRDDVPVFEINGDVDEARLRRIAEKMNARSEDCGEGCPLVIGHTVDGKPEWEQPPLVGYTDQYKVKAGRRGIPTLYCREKLYPETEVGGRMVSAAELRRRYPRRSVEFLPKDDIIDPISMLGATTPRQDVMMVRHGSDAPRVRYAYPGLAAGAPPAPPAAPADPGAAPLEDMVGAEPPLTTPPAPGAQPPALDGTTIINAFREFLAQLETMQGGQEQAAPQPAPGPPAATPPPGPPVEKEPEPAAAPGEADKEKYDAGVAGANAGYVPGFGQEKEKMATDNERIRFSKLESTVAEQQKTITKLLQENAEIKQENADTKRRYHREQCGRRLIEFREGGVQLEVDEELDFMVPLDQSKPAMTDEQITKHLDRIKVHYQRIPGGRLIDTSGVDIGGGAKNGRKGTREQCEKAAKLASQNYKGGNYATALADVLAGAV